MESMVGQQELHCVTIINLSENSGKFRKVVGKFSDVLRKVVEHPVKAIFVKILSKTYESRRS